MTIKETIKTDSELRREFYRKQGDRWRSQNRAKYNRYAREYYAQHKKEISLKTYGPDNRKCKWCGSDITHIFPRKIMFCNANHRKHYNAQRKKEWLSRKKLQALADLQQTKVPTGQ